MFHMILSVNNNYFPKQGNQLIIIIEMSHVSFEDQILKSYLYEQHIWGVKERRVTHMKASVMPLYATSPSARFNSCSRVFTTSNGFTTNAEVAPAPMPASREHQNTASPASEHHKL